MGQAEKETMMTEVVRSAEEILKWAKAHPKCTLRELEERIQEWKTRIGTRMLEAAVATQGTRAWAERTCSWEGSGYLKDTVNGK